MRPTMYAGVFYVSATLLAVPPVPLRDPSGINKGRYISMSLPSNGGEPTALRVTLVSLHHVEPPYTGGSSIPFTEFEGQIRWVGPPVFAAESDNDPTPFVAAHLQCTPYYHDWSTLGLFHVYGDAVVPNSSYDVVTLDQSCAGAEEGCADLSAPLAIATARYGDVLAPFNPPSTSAQPSVDDFGECINKIRQVVGASTKAIMQLQPNVLDPTRTVNVVDCLMVGDAIPGEPYPYLPTSCGASHHAYAESTHASVPALGNATLRVFITPVPAQAASSYPTGTQIVGQELIAPTGGFRAFFNLQFQDWNPSNADPLFRGWQIQIDAESMLGINASPPAPGADVVPAQEPCSGGSAGNAECRTAFGEAGARCGLNMCVPAFVSSVPSGGFPANPDWILLGVGDPFNFVSENSPTGLIIGGGRTRPFTELIMDEGERKYVGTLVLDIPSEAVGHVYTISVRPGSETMAVSGDLGPPIDTPFAELDPAIIRIGTQTDATGINRSRFVSFVPGHAGEQMAIRVRLVSLHHVNPAYTGGPSIPFTSFEGQYRWVGPPTQYTESSASGTPFQASNLQCTPHYQDWGSAGYLHVTGSAIVPSSQYEVEYVPISCIGGEESCPDISAPIALATSRWADVEREFNPPSSTTQPDLGDVSALVNKFRSAAGAPIKARALLAGEDAFGNITATTLNLDFNFSHIAACVDAFKGKPYPHTIEACP